MRPTPGADLLAFDEQNGRAVVLHVTGETVEWQVSRALAAAAEVASWDAAKLASVSDALEAVVPGDSPALVLVAGGFDPRALATVEWLAKRHGVEVSCFSVSVLRFGNERLLSVHREPRDGAVGRSGRPGAVDADRRQRAGRGARRAAGGGQHAAAAVTSFVPQRAGRAAAGPRWVASPPRSARPTGRGRSPDRGTRR